MVGNDLSFDHETATQHSFILRVTHTNGASDDFTIIIPVGDVNDQPPQIHIQDVRFFETVGNEILQTGYFIHEFTGSADVAGTDLTWALIDDPSGKFTLMANGWLQLRDAGQYDYEDNTGPYEITVQATDEAGNSARWTTHVEVRNINEHPYFEDGPFGGVTVTPGEINVMPPAAYDPEGDQLTWSFVPNPYGHAQDSDFFNIDSATGAITWKVAPVVGQKTDELGNGRYSVSIRIEDPQGLERVQNYTIIVPDAPYIGQGNAPISFDIIQGATAVTTLSGTISDTSPAGEIFWSLSGTHAHLFDIDNNGDIRWVNAPVFSTTPSDNIYSFTAILTDNHNLTDTIDITVNVLESSPLVLTSGLTSSAYDENTNLAVGDMIYTAAATYQGSTTGVSMSLVAGGSLFNELAIDPTTGQVFIVGNDLSFDHETATQQTFVLRVSHTSGTTHDFTITIPVNDVNEAPEIFQGDAPLNAFASVGDPNVAAISAIDPDQNDSLSWTWAGEDAADFSIIDGIITWITPPSPGQVSADSDNIFEITAIVSDDDGLQDTIDVLITLL